MGVFVQTCACSTSLSLDLHFSPTMASELFSIQQYTIPCQHIREYPHGTRNDQEDILQLAVKQYTPLERGVGEGAVTIIATHANGFPKVRTGRHDYCRDWSDRL